MEPKYTARHVSPAGEARVGREERAAQPRRRRRQEPLGLLGLRIVLLTALTLVTFAFFHHVLPRLTAASAPAPSPVALMATPEPTEAPELTPEPTPEPEDTRTEWQKKFAEHFTDEVVITDSSYTSPNVSITITKDTYTAENGRTTDYYVADIYIAQIENFQTYFSHGAYTYYGNQNPIDMANDSKAILAIDGDYADNQKFGLLVRNGELYYSEQTYCDICVLYADGTMKTYGPRDYLSEDVLAANPFQTWKFGPALLDENGQRLENINVSKEIAWDNPRSALGYYEPGHYCFFICDGRQLHSRGLTIWQLADIMSELGCKQAYNMDGGGSAMMIYQGEIISSPSNGIRDIGDILLIRELDAALPEDAAAVSDTEEVG